VSNNNGGRFPSSDFRARREALRWSQEKLARELDVSTSTVRNWERGDGGPSYENLLRIYAVMNWLPDELISAMRVKLKEQMAREQARNTIQPPLVASLTG
jgi:transcriptional regulator with XRE-family HTH domain